MASDEVAAGEGALKTCNTCSEPPSWKSSTIEPSALQGLRADARRPEDEMVGAERRHELAQIREEGTLGPVAPHLERAHLPELAGELPEARVGDGIEQVAGETSKRP